MRNCLPLFVLMIIIGYGAYNAYTKKTPSSNSAAKQQAAIQKPIPTTPNKKDELSRIDTDEYLYDYIVDVIVNGSKDLRFKENEIMEGGFVSKEDAAKVACFVMEMSGRKCKDSYPKDAQLFYTSACGGCHGNDGKGISGAYPDLTKKELLGIAKRKEWLRSKVTQ